MCGNAWWEVLQSRGRCRQAAPLVPVGPMDPRQTSTSKQATKPSHASSPPEALAPHAILVHPRRHSRRRAVECREHGAQGAARGTLGWLLCRLLRRRHGAEKIQKVGGDPAANQNQKSKLRVRGCIDTERQLVNRFAQRSATATGACNAHGAAGHASCLQPSRPRQLTMRPARPPTWPPPTCRAPLPPPAAAAPSLSHPAPRAHHRGTGTRCPAAPVGHGGAYGRQLGQSKSTTEGTAASAGQVNQGRAG